MTAVALRGVGVTEGVIVCLSVSVGYILMELFYYSVRCEGS